MAAVNPSSRLWSLVVSPVTFVILSLAWVLDLAVGSMLAYRADPRFWMKMDAVPFNRWLHEVAPRAFPDSLWVYVLVGLTWAVVASLVLCTLNWFFRRRRRAKGMGEVFVHLGFLFIFIGFVLGSGWGTRVQGIPVPEGGRAPVGNTGLVLSVEKVDEVRGPSGRAWDTVSQVALLREGRAVARGTVRTNHPLIWGSTVVYPQGAQTLVNGARVATTVGTFDLVPRRPVLLPDGRRLVLVAALSPGERQGPYIGPGVVVVLAGPDGSRLGGAWLSPGMGGVADLGGVGARLIDLDVAPNGFYNVHHDPGVWWVIAGAVLLTLGTLWALAGYLRNRTPAPV